MIGRPNSRVDFVWFGEREEVVEGGQGGVENRVGELQ